MLVLVDRIFVALEVEAKVDRMLDYLYTPLILIA